MIPKNILIGLLAGLLCGLVPLIYGILQKATLWAVVGITITTIGGVIFSLFGKSPFSAIVIAVLFILFIVAEQKHKSKHAENREEHDDYDDSYNN